MQKKLATLVLAVVVSLAMLILAGFTYRKFGAGALWRLWLIYRYFEADRLLESFYETLERFDRMIEAWEKTRASFEEERSA
jgi:cell division protein FtsW (lipid II flippase)